MTIVWENDTYPSNQLESLKWVLNAGKGDILVSCVLKREENNFYLCMWASMLELNVT